MRDASQTSSDDEVSIASVTLPEDVEAGARHIVDPAPLRRSLVVGDRIVFKFNPPHGEGFGTYVGQGNKKSDRDKTLCRVAWDDGGDELVQLNEVRKFQGHNFDDLDFGQWAILSSKPTPHVPESFLFAAQEQVEQNVFLRDLHDVPDGTLMYPLNAVDDRLHGPFTESQVKQQDSWPEWKSAADKKNEQIFERDVYDLVDEKEIKRKGHFVFPTRFVYTYNSKGVRKARLVVRGDYQKFANDDDQVPDQDEFPEYYSNYDVETHVLTHGLNSDFSDKHLHSAKRKHVSWKEDGDGKSLTGVPQATTGGGDVLAKQASKRTSPTTSISSSKTLSKAATQNMGRKLFSPVVNRAAHMSIIVLTVTKQMLVGPRTRNLRKKELILDNGRNL